MAEETEKDATDSTSQPAPTSEPAPQRVEAEVDAGGDENPLRQMGRFLKTYWSHILLVILVPVVMYRGINYFQERDALARESAYWEFETAMNDKTLNPTKFMDLAESHRDVAGFQGRCLLVAAELLHRDGLAASIHGAKLTVEERQQRLTRAETLYLRISNLPDRTPLQELKAQFGIASILETRGKFDEARKVYEAIGKLAEEAWPVQAAIAKQRLENLDELREKLPFPKKRKEVTLEDLRE